MINIGITGSNGFIGWHLSKTLSLQPKEFHLIEFSRDWFDNNTMLDEFVSQCDVIIHLAGLNRHSNEKVLYDTNIELTKILINSFNRTGFKGQLLFSSSIHEDRNNTFGNSKRLSRELFSDWAKNNCANFKGLIIPNVFGAFGVPFYNSVVATFSHQLANNENPKIETDATLNLIYINDLINNIIELFNLDSEETVHIKHTDTYKVSQILQLLNQYKTTYLEKGHIPFFKNQFEINLFNTFRSYFKIAKHYPVKYKNNIDERGNFVEIIRLETGGQVSFSTTKPGITRGNHFHIRKIERFSVIKGKALIQLRKIGTNEVFDYHLSGNEPAYVDMPIWYTHNIKNIGDEELYTMFWINEFYDASDPDTYLEKV
jgi:UDP-2-acetamido-2,6-beta-L-arabino-hexul-4-ose reductase